MSSVVSGQTSVSLGFLESVVGTTTTAGTCQDNVNLSGGTQYANGSGSGQVAVQWSETVSLSSATTYNLQSLTGVLGTKTFTTVRALYITNGHATATLKVGNAATHPWSGPIETSTGIIDVGPMGRLFYEAPVAGWAVSSTVNSLLLDPGASTIPISIIIVGS